MLFFPYFVGLNQIEMSERARDRHCRLLSLVNFGAFRIKRQQRKQVGGQEGGQRAPEYIQTSRQLEAPSRLRCRRCLRILAIFRPAASDEATRLFLFFSFLMLHVAISPVPRREEKWQLLRICWRINLCLGDITMEIRTLDSVIVHLHAFVVLQY